MENEEARLSAVLDRNFRKALRIVGENHTRQFSSMWNFLPGADGFYFSARPLLNSFKVSLHRNNNRGYLAHAKSHFQRKRTEGALTQSKRTVHEWALPLPERGETRQVTSVRLPSDFMRDAAHPYVHQGKVLVFGIEPASALEIGVFFSRDARTALEEKLKAIGTPLWYSAIDDWFDVWVVVRSVDFDPSILPTSGQVNSATIKPLETIQSDWQLEGLNVLFWNAPKDGEVLQLIDIGGASIRQNS